MVVEENGRRTEVKVTSKGLVVVVWVGSVYVVVVVVMAIIVSGLK